MSVTLLNFSLSLFQTTSLSLYTSNITSSVIYILPFSSSRFSHILSLLELSLILHIMKGRMFCASQASTAICSSMDHVDHKQTTTVDDERTSGRAIDRHNPIIKDPRRSFADDFIKLPPSGAEDGEISNKKLEIYKGRRSFTGRRSTGSGGGGGAAALLKLITSDISLARKSFSCVARPACDFINTPVGSTRFLLGSDSESKSGGSAGQDPAKTVEAVAVAPAGEDITLTEEKKTTCDIGGSDQQVVVLKVSLHCRGCEGKVRKHLARMQGVTSFNIDFAAKKVTVTGDITPLEILDSISKVKNAQFWTTPTIPKPNVNIQNP
ncbi:PREDICTED: protein SODIUM POTASSIUM ROOT DEFECTIVE 2-like isoform X1 [Camelina sativa]|uniref:Protein SODIUM POTASSIUM ROOT DEFECTIVE 2-like isoform X1 n=1 Tax=Camelina sativa TaxID=90675 RepID=A0ABM0Z235_CAMSA|nr:PREDICTED: protein SODIUM POTASSIUM ROOT DEFECTIVE 2-like isoform X1 [Camelina sativa]